MTGPDRPRTVVIADDDIDVAQALARVVQSLGHETHIAHDGVEALALLRTVKADVLLSDIDMPRMDGAALVAQVRREQLAPVRILITANATLETALTAINQGEVYRYVQKPWRHGELVATLEEAFARLADIAREQAVAKAVRRMEAVREALENEFPGITHIERAEGVYLLDKKRAVRTLEMLRTTTLYQLLEGSLKQDPST